MREIKFRAWDEGQKTMLYPAEPDDNGKFWIITGEYGDVAFPFDFPGGYRFISDNYVIMQFTGLLDKNGREVYEGDIFMYYEDHYDGIDYSEGEQFRVLWEPGLYAFTVHDAVGRLFLYEIATLFDVDDLGDETCPLFEVIGNVHENPELLEVE